jgi:hypothetical protein
MTSTYADKRFMYRATFDARTWKPKYIVVLSKHGNKELAASSDQLAIEAAERLLSL